MKISQQRCLPPCVVEKQWDVQAHSEPLLGTHEHDAEEAVDRILWKHQLMEKHTKSKDKFFFSLGQDH